MQSIRNILKIRVLHFKIKIIQTIRTDRAARTIRNTENVTRSNVSSSVAAKLRRPREAIKIRGLGSERPIEKELITGSTCLKNCHRNSVESPPPCVYACASTRYQYPRESPLYFPPLHHCRQRFTAATIARVVYRAARKTTIHAILSCPRRHSLSRHDRRSFCSRMRRDSRACSSFSPFSERSRFKRGR